MYKSFIDSEQGVLVEVDFQWLFAIKIPETLVIQPRVLKT